MGAGLSVVAASGVCVECGVEGRKSVGPRTIA